MKQATGLIFLGPPGSGKGTQAQLLAQQLHIPHISTGEILRQAIADQTPLGQQAQSYMDKGELVPDDLLLGLVRERLNQPDAQNGWILDGFPRNVSQAEFLDQLLKELSKFSEKAINLEVSDDLLIARLLSRGRQDDNEDTIRRRLEVYREQTQPVINYYHQHGRLTSIDGNPSPEEVTASVKQAIAS